MWLACLLLAASPPEITLAHGSESERETRDALLRVLERYPAASVWRFQPTLVIDETVTIGVRSVPRIDAQFRYRPWHLLAAYLAAQIASRDDVYARANRELGRRYPGRSRVAARCLEYVALRESIGEAAAREVIGEKAAMVSDVYLLVLDPEESPKIEALVKRFGLAPR